MTQPPPPRPALFTVALQVVAAFFVADVLWRTLPAEVGAHGWSPAAFALVAIVVAIVALVLWSAYGRRRRTRSDTPQA